MNNFAKLIKIGNILKPKPHAKGPRNDRFHSCIALHGFDYDLDDGTIKKASNVMNNCHSSYFSHIYCIQSKQEPEKSTKMIFFALNWLFC